MPGKWGSSGQAGLGKKEREGLGYPAEPCCFLYYLLFCTLFRKQSYTFLHEQFTMNAQQSIRAKQPVLSIPRTMRGGMVALFFLTQGLNSAKITDWILETTRVKWQSVPQTEAGKNRAIHASCPMRIGYLPQSLTFRPSSSGTSPLNKYSAFLNWAMQSNGIRIFWFFHQLPLSVIGHSPRWLQAWYKES